MSVRIVAKGTLGEPPRPWKQALVLEMDCRAAARAPKGLPPTSDAMVTVFCTADAWREVQAAAAQGQRLQAEGEPCLGVPPGVAAGDVVMVATGLLAVATSAAAMVSVPTLPLPPAERRVAGTRRPKSPPRPPVAAEVAREVWEAEDGRCEACGRAMDRSCACFARVDSRRREFAASNLHLLCPDCKNRAPDPLRQVVLSRVVLQQTGARRQQQPEEAAAWLQQALWQDGVLVRQGEWLRNYWLPGVGNFSLRLRPEGAPIVVQAHWGRSLEIRKRPQARTRGFPRPQRT